MLLPFWRLSFKNALINWIFLESIAPCFSFINLLGAMGPVPPIQFFNNLLLVLLPPVVFLISFIVTTALAIKPFPWSIIALSAPLILILIACNFALILLAALSEVENRDFAASCFLPMDIMNEESSEAPQDFWFTGVVAAGFAGVVAAGFAGVVAAGFAGVVAAGFAGVVAAGFAGVVAAGFAGVVTWVDLGRPVGTKAAADMSGVAAMVRTGLIWEIMLAWTGISAA
jgi:hypothetical protein